METKYILTHDSGMVGIEESLEWQRNIKDGYTFSMGELKLDALRYDEIIEKINNFDSKIKEYIYKDKTKEDYIKLIGDKALITYDKPLTRKNEKFFYMNVLTKSEEINSELWNILSEYKVSQNIIADISNTYLTNDGSIGHNYSTTYLEDLYDIKNEYTPYIDLFELFSQFDISDDKILILLGEPGLGKSKLITNYMKYRLENFIPQYEDDNIGLRVDYVKNTAILGKDGYWNNLESREIDVVVLDDLDFMLSKRDNDILSEEDVLKNNFLNYLLSYTDGVLSNKTKFIISTNQRFKEIDTAVLRKGRLFDVLELRRLSNKEAKDLWVNEKLKLEDFDKIFKNEENILQSDLGSEIKKFKKYNSKIPKPYLKESSISKIEEIRKDNKIRL